tara:strand:+ start:522 stop:1499 length:978 start_codon:yes stop_codon:yes gene_type:complete
MKKNIAVVGAGMAGITIASMVNGKFNVDVFEKSKGVGGRMSTRKETPFIFDHGAQFFKIKTSDFKNYLSELFSQQIIQPWNFRLAYFDGLNLSKIKFIKDEDKFYVGVPNMDTIIKHLSKNCNVILNTKIERIIKENDKWNLYDQNKKSYGTYDWVVLSLPARQSLELITEKISFYPLIEKIQMKGCFSLMVGMSKSLNLDYDAALIENEDIAWIAVNNSKPSRMNNYCLLINSSYEYASKNINTSKNKVLKHLLNVSSKFVNYDLLKSNMIKIHEWRYVEAKCTPKEDYFIDQKEKVAVCGDWFINSRVEGAFLSANQLFKEII